MITTLIFSKDRACQLDLLLRSIYRNFTHVSMDIHVLCKATSGDFMRGYDKLKKTYNTVEFWDEINFHEDTSRIIAMGGDYTCFFVDDNIVYRKPEVRGEQIEAVFNQLPQFGCFSFRVGLNTTVQNPYTDPPTTIKIDHPMAEVMVDKIATLAWDRRSIPQYGNNFGYPFSVDGHIYDRNVMLAAVGTYDFNTPNAFEGCFPVKYIPTGMGCLKQSAVVNNPINLVGSSQNAAGAWWGHSLTELNDAYLGGKEIDLDDLCKNEVKGCHQEMEIKLCDSSS